MRKSRTVDHVMCALFTALIIAGAFIRIDFVLPITLQSTFAVLAGLLLGKRGGALCTLVYMVLGLAGLPVFAQGGGLMYILKPSFGYIIGFVPGAFTAGAVMERKKQPKAKFIYCAGALGLMCIYVIGCVYSCIVMSFYVHGGKEQLAAYMFTALAALPMDLLLLIPASVVTKRVLPVIL